MSDKIAIFVSVKQQVNDINSTLTGLNITDAVWKGDAEYAGGCGTSCSECPFNTCNHGCLFYEMKATDGQCTCEEKFIAKTVAYIADYLRSKDDVLDRKSTRLNSSHLA